MKKKTLHYPTLPSIVAKCDVWPRKIYIFTLYSNIITNFVKNK